MEMSYTKETIMYFFIDLWAEIEINHKSFHIKLKH